MTFTNATLFSSFILLASFGPVAGQAAPRTVQPGAPGVDSRVVPSGPALPVPHTEADVRFMQGMIPHHQQALEMTALVPSRSAREDVRLLALRIELSQHDEILLMQHWLEDRGEEVPGADAHASHAGHAGHGATHAELMPGMLTPEDMERLASATGAEFDRLFLEAMIRHHEGAIVMVQELFASPGAARGSEIFQFAADVEADQGIEIARMRGMLNPGR